MSVSYTIMLYNIGVINKIMKYLFKVTALNKVAFKSHGFIKHIKLLIMSLYGDDTTHKPLWIFEPKTSRHSVGTNTTI